MSSPSALIDSKVAERAMLKHPFYEAWTEGRLPLDTLRAYARQYFHHVEAFPRAVSAVHSACPNRDGRRMLLITFVDHTACTFDFEIDWVAAGKQHSTIVDNGGQPFRVLGDATLPRFEVDGTGGATFLVPQAPGA